MKQQEIADLLEVPERTLRDWKNNNRSKLYKLLSNLDYEAVVELLSHDNHEDLKKLLENELYFDNQLDFERELYKKLVSGRDNKNWLELAQDQSLSDAARARAAYLYTFFTKKPIKNYRKKQLNVGFFHKTKPHDGDGYAKMYGLSNGLDVQRYNQYRITGGF